MGESEYDDDVVVIVGNPRSGSRTSDAATRVALALAVGGGRPTVIELGALGPDLFDPTSDAVRQALSAVEAASLVIIASPTYKATFTGLLKLFLDLLPTGEGFRDTVVVPLMLGGDYAHALAPEVFLKPVLAELGATMPAPGLFLIESSYRSDGRINDYIDRWAPVLSRRNEVEGT